jgi:hypothetical protein
MTFENRMTIYYSIIITNEHNTNKINKRHFLMGIRALLSVEGLLQIS